MNANLLIYILSGALIVTAIVFLAYVLTGQKRIKKIVESVTYDVNEARNSTLLSFPLPIAVFRLDDTRIIWANDMFFSCCGDESSRLDAKISKIVPEFSSKWLMEGRNQFPSLITVGNRKYRVHGNVIRQTSKEERDETQAFMGITYWLDVTEYDDIRIEYEQTRPVTEIIVIDNLDELFKNQPDRVRNDIIDEVSDCLEEWVQSYHGLLRKFDRDRFLAIFNRQDLFQMKDAKFPILEKIHKIESPSGINVTISIGIGDDAADFSESLQFANMATELALTRGGDQAVIKNKLNFEFYGGRGMEIEKRNKVKSRVIANTLGELIKDSSRIFVMGHKYSDLDSIGAAVGICCLARKFNVNANIVVDEKTTAAASLIKRMQAEKEYKYTFINPQEAVVKADGRTLLIVVDTNRPEQVEDSDLLDTINRVAVIDHHRVAATYIKNAALGFVEPYASSACELVTEILEEFTDKNDILRCESEALLSGITLDTKDFTIRTGERTFEAAVFLKHAGADTTDVKKLRQNNMSDTISKYRILQNAELYRNVAIAVPIVPQSRVVAAQAADELLNISGVEASVVIAPGINGGVFASARSIGELNVQIIMEKLGGGGNRSAAAVQFKDLSLEEAVEKVYRAIDEYLE